MKQGKGNNLKGVCDQWSFWQAGAVCVCSQGFFCFGLRSVPFSLASVTPRSLAVSLGPTWENNGCGWVRLCLAGTLLCAVMDGLTDLNLTHVPLNVCVVVEGTDVPDDTRKTPHLHLQLLTRSMLPPMFEPRVEYRK